VLEVLVIVAAPAIAITCTRRKPQRSGLDLDGRHRRHPHRYDPPTNTKEHT
jgi:hypothetical protein